MDNTQTPPEKPANLPALTPRQLAARRTNARKTTGPRTPEGKAASRLNALKHGFWSRDIVNPNLDGAELVEDFDRLLSALLDDLKPVGAVEELLVEEVAGCCWRLRRALRFEDRTTWWDEENLRRDAKQNDDDDYAGIPAGLVAMFGKSPERQARRKRLRTLDRWNLNRLLLPDSDHLNQILRFERSLKRNLYRALKNLRTIQAARLRSESPAAQSAESVKPGGNV
jgi:hypothetical protein